MRKRHKKRMILLGIVVVVCMVCSIFYVNEQRHHECIGQGCPICLQVHTAKDLRNSIESAVLGTLFAWPIYLMLMNIVGFIKIGIERLSPITLKVKLLN